MKTNAFLRLVVAAVILAIGILFLEDKRNELKSRGGKAANKTKGDRNKTPVSNTDYIFFESLSRNLFLSLQ